MSSAATPPTATSTFVRDIHRELLDRKLKGGEYEESIVYFKLDVFLFMSSGVTLIA